MRRAAQAVIDELDRARRSSSRASRAGRVAEARATWSCCRRSRRCCGSPRRARRSSATTASRLSRTFFPRKRARITHAPIGVDRGDLAGRRAVRPAARRRRDRADGRQRGRAQAVAVRVPVRRADRARRSRAPGCPRGCCGSSTAGRRPAGRSSTRAVDQVRLTGSADVGREVGEACARALKPATLALAGNDPMLVLERRAARARGRRRGVGRVRERRAGGRVDRARLRRCRRCTTGSSPASSRGARALRVGDPLDAADRGRAADDAPSAPTRVRVADRRRGRRAARRCTAAATGRARTSRPPC